MTDNTRPRAKPFLKWAGGKNQLLSQIEVNLPVGLKNGRITKYAEPFIGSGSLFFFMAHQFQLTDYFIADINKDLILAYRVIQQEAEALIQLLGDIQNKYLPMQPSQREAYFYDTRTAFNENQSTISYEATDPTSIQRVAQLIFLNRTCFNGLYRVNSKGEFNVPFGRHKKPKICAAKNLRRVSQLLEMCQIHHGDFTACRDFVDEQTFVYFDPPYRPLNQTASFNTYAQKRFDDAEQQRLANFYQELAAQGTALMLSNSDPHNEDPTDNFFQTLYAGFTIQKVTARRIINSDGAKRGNITEILVTNY